MRKAVALFAVTLAVLGLPLAASASEVLYTLSCVSSDQVCDRFYDNGTITFSLPQFPIPDRIDTGRAFILNTVPGTVNGNPATFTQMYFFAAPTAGLVFTADPKTKEGQNSFTFVGVQLFQGTLGSPMLVAGDFPLRGNLAVVGQAQIHVQAGLGLGSPVPEPATWIVMFSALAILAIARYLVRRRSSDAFQAAESSLTVT